MISFSNTHSSDARWELATRLSASATVPEQALQSIFQSAIECLEEINNRQFENTLIKTV